METRSQCRMSALTDIGGLRPNNEDQYLVERVSNWIVAAVADGMGGAAGGEVASWLAVHTVSSLFRLNADRLPVSEVMADCIVLAHERIRQRGNTSFGNLNMGTTLTFVAFPENMDSPGSSRPVALGHVGDSRLYLVDRIGVRQVTRDHSMTQHLLDSGVLTPQTARNFPYRNVIYKSLGGSRELVPDPIQTLDVPQGTILLLCTDGLSNYLDPVDMWKIVNHSRNLSRAARLMVDLALMRGGADNITVVLVSIGRPRFSVRRPGLPAKMIRLREVRSFPRRAFAGVARLTGLGRKPQADNLSTGILSLPPPEAGCMYPGRMNEAGAEIPAGGRSGTKKPPRAELCVVSGHLAGRSFPLGTRARIGRVRGEVVLEDASVSREHALLVLREGCYVLNGVDATAPVVINGRKIRKERKLSAGDEIRIGNIRLVFRMSGSRKSKGRSEKRKEKSEKQVSGDRKIRNKA